MGLSIEFAKTPTMHVKTTLPPTLYFPGEAEIRYYVKVTVNRPQLLKENPRAVNIFLSSSSCWTTLTPQQIVNFNFLPIEPPRATSDGETYARRQYEFKSTSTMPGALESPIEKRPSFPNPFKKSPTGSSLPTSPISSESPPRFRIEARLPNPAIVTCSQELPLRILVTSLAQRDAPLHLQSLQVELIGYTYVRAHEVQRRESNSWVICSHANMNLPIGSPSDPANATTEIPSSYWRTDRLPSTVAPTFQTCNLRREYELEVRIGLGYGGGKTPQITIQPLRLPLKVFSGIRPPPELLKAMEAASERPPLPAKKPTLPDYDPSPIAPGSSQMAPSSATNSAPPVSVPARPPHSAEERYDDAPPSYEDAIASDMPAIDGPRPEYEPPPPPAEGDGGLGRDEKAPRRLGV